MKDPSHPTQHGHNLTGFEKYLMTPPHFQVKKPAFLLLQFVLKVFRKLLAALALRQRCWSRNDALDIEQLLRTYPGNTCYSEPAPFPKEWSQNSKQLETFLEDFCTKTAQQFPKFLKADGGSVLMMLDQIGVAIGMPLYKWMPWEEDKWVKK